MTFVSVQSFAALVYQSIGGVPANNLCDAGDVFKTLKPVSVCNKWVEIKSRYSGEADTGCTKWGKGIQSSTVLTEEKSKHMKDNCNYGPYTIPACEE